MSNSKHTTSPAGHGHAGAQFLDDFASRYRLAMALIQEPPSATELRIVQLTAHVRRRAGRQVEGDEAGAQRSGERRMGRR